MVQIVAVDREGVVAIGNREIVHEPGDGSNPAVLLTFKTIDATTMFNLQKRIHDLFWKNRKLTARILQDRFA